MPCIEAWVDRVLDSHSNPTVATVSVAWAWLAPAARLNGAALALQKAPG